MEISDNQSFSIPEDVMYQEVDGETVLLDLASEGYFGLDEIGTRLWSLVAAGETVSKVVETLLGEYEVEKAVLAGDVRILLEELLEAGLIRPEC